VVTDVLAKLPVQGFHVHFGTRVRSGIVATSFDVHVEATQPTRTYGSIRAMLDAAPLPDGVRARALRTFQRLAVAESKVHRSAIDDVHFHEVGAVDAICDVVGSAAALDHLGAELVVSPLPMGRGFVKAAHGTLPLPPPAVVECLAGLSTYDAGIDFELFTPTGAAIVGAHAGSSSRWPAMSPVRVGWGAGTADLKDRPNVLRAVLGRPSTAQAAGDTSATHVVLEANVDDATGELASTWIDALMAAGALDAWATPILMKKGRPALTISALAALDHADSVAHAMLRETTSLGVRRHPVSRAERPRRIVTVETPYGSIPVKLAEGPFGPPQAKPELDACALAARAHGVPVREVIRAATIAAASHLKP
jgi:pyridinium-3,5-bisthiocarboxylic acid mononucleotide nickel chelatase